MLNQKILTLATMATVSMKPTSSSHAAGQRDTVHHLFERLFALFL
jgi:hypothetical protein